MVVEDTHESSRANESLDREGLLVLDISENAEPVVKLSGEIVIDARRRANSHPPDEINPKAFNQMGELYRAVRTAFASGDDQKGMNRALLKEAKELGLDAKEAVVIGQAPEHWKPTTHIAARFVRKR